MGIKVRDDVVVSESGDSLGLAVKNIVAALDSALEDGWQTGDDLPPIAATSLTSAMEIMRVAKDLKEDAKADPEAFTTSLLLRVKEAVFLFFNKE